MNFSIKNTQVTKTAAGHDAFNHHSYLYDPIIAIYMITVKRFIPVVELSCDQCRLKGSRDWVQYRVQSLPLASRKMEHFLKRT